MKYLVMWPKSENVVHINYHYTQFGEIIDYLDKKFPNSIIPSDCDVSSNDVIELIRTNNIKKVVMNVNYENAKNAFSMAKKMNEQFTGIQILAYGSLPKMLPNIFTNSDFNAIFKDGDYECCIESFLENNLDEINKLNGLYLIHNGKLIETNRGNYIQSNQWGMSNKERVPVQEYDNIKGKNRYVINISRGCPYGCKHCLIQLTEGRRERRRSIDNLEKVIDKIKSDYKHIKIWAANFTLDKEYVKQFCELMREKYPDITWECATRIDLVRDKEMLQDMYKSGCRQISLGIESLNNDELIHTKDFNENEIKRAISDVHDAGIKVKGCIMLGMPNQTKESIVSTIKFLMDNQVIIRPTIYTPYHALGEKVDINMLSNYNRKTLKNNNVLGVTPDQLLQLVKDPYNYEQILELREEKATVSNLTSKDILRLTAYGMHEKPGYISRQIQEFDRKINNKSMEEEER